MLILRRKVKPDSVVYSDTFASSNTLALEGYHHVTINHERSLVTLGGRHTSGIENYWNPANCHLQNFSGVPKESFYLFLKECEWQFNAGS